MGIYKDLNDYEIMYMVEENDEAKELLFEKYKPIILRIASDHKDEGKKCGLELDDLIQEGYLGLYNAIINYNSNKDSLFYTYAILLIKSRILNTIRKYSAKKHSCLNNSISIYDNVFDSNDNTLLDVLCDRDSIAPESALMEQELSQQLSNFIFSLDFEIASILELKMNGFSYMDISKISDRSVKSITNIVFRYNNKLQKYLLQNYKMISH